MTSPLHPAQPLVLHMSPGLSHTLHQAQVFNYVTAFTRLNCVHGYRKVKTKVPKIPQSLKRVSATTGNGLCELNPYETAPWAFRQA